MKEPFLLRMPINMKSWFEEESNTRGLTLTGLILAILSEYQKQNNKTN